MHRFLLCFIALPLTIIAGCLSSSRDSDEDGDGTPDDIDNCPTVSNSDQADEDSDGVGYACESCEIVSLVGDLWPGQGYGYPAYLTVMNGKLYFSADDGVQGKEPWTYNPVTGALAMGEITPGSDFSTPCQFTTLNSNLHFWVSDENNEHWLWKFNRGMGL